MIVHYLRKIKLPKINIDIDTMSYLTIGMTGADIKNIVNIAGSSVISGNRAKITNMDIMNAYEQISMGLRKNNLNTKKTELEKTAIHEAGHALLSLLNEKAGNSLRLNKITILPVGDALGFCSFIPKENQKYLNEVELINQMEVAFGGRLAEELIYGRESITTGCSNDLAQSYNIAKEMIYNLKMQNEGGPLSIDGEKMSVEQNNLLESKIHKISLEALKSARSKLNVNIDKLKKLADILIQKETLSSEEARIILNI